MRCLKSSLLAIMVALFTVGKSNAASLGAAPNLGVVTNATVKFLASDGTTLLGTGNTGANGVVRVNVGSYSGPVNILTVPTRFSVNTTAGSLTASQAGRYAAILAALKRPGAGASAPGLRALQRDAANGNINGPAPTNDFVNRLGAAIRGQWPPTSVIGAFGS